MWPKTNPVFLLISAGDWKEGGWDPDQSIKLAAYVVPLGVDLVDCSSGGIPPKIEIAVKAGYQVAARRSSGQEIIGNERVANMRLLQIPFSHCQPPSFIQRPANPASTV